VFGLGVLRICSSGGSLLLPGVREKMFTDCSLSSGQVSDPLSTHSVKRTEFWRITGRRLGLALTDCSLKSHSNLAIIAIMKKASITEAKNNLSALIDTVKGGSPVLIVDRGRPVARLEPVAGIRSGDDSRLARLIRDGIVRPARSVLPKTLFANRPARVRKGASGVRALLDERQDGR
jgi:prevent-host-death family protein